MLAVPCCLRSSAQAALMISIVFRLQGVVQSSSTTRASSFDPSNSHLLSRRDKTLVCCFSKLYGRGAHTRRSNKQLQAGERAENGRASLFMQNPSGAIRRYLRTSWISTTSLEFIGTVTPRSPSLSLFTTSSVSGRSRVRAFNMVTCSDVNCLGEPISR